MRVLIVTNMYPPHHYGGYELSCRDVVSRWRDRGHEVTVLTSRMRVPGVSDPPAERRSGVRRDLHIYWRDHRILDPPMPQTIAWEHANQRALRSALKDARPDVVSIWHMGSMSFGLLTTLIEDGRPLVYVVCDDWLIYGPKVDPWIRRFDGRVRRARWASAMTQLPTHLGDVGESGTFCFVSETIRRRAEAASRWTYPNTCVVPSGIDLRDFPITDEPPRPWEWRLLYVGRIDERKGIDVAVRCLPQLPQQATLRIVGRGDDDYLRGLHRLAADLGVADRVSFAVADRSSLAETYAAADVVLFPVRWDEPFGLVPLEAMACGTPVVATGLGGSSEFLRDGENCVLAAPDDVESTVGAVRRLAASPDLRQRLWDEGRQTARKLTTDSYSGLLEAAHLRSLAC